MRILEEVCPGPLNFAAKFRLKVSISITHLPYSATHSFSQLALDYIGGSPKLRSFYGYTPDLQGISQAIEHRHRYRVDRKTLVSVLQRQYSALSAGSKTTQNITLLLQENTFTICTAHQPNLMTGYLYFIYKILHAIVLADQLAKNHPGYNFVPVYYMGSEDNDLEELGTFRFNGLKFVWDAAGQKGAVGRMSTESVKQILDELFLRMGPPGPFCDELKELLLTAYGGQPTIGRATAWLVNELFSRYGLIVLDPDNPQLKQQFTSIMKEDLLHHTANGIVLQQAANLSEHYKIQAHPRPVNLFYLQDGLRERIEKTGDGWKVLNTSKRWNEAELTRELEQYPERFSPNVILRGLFQEIILPNVGFIGGGAEVAYWLQLKPLFEHYSVFFPPVLLRQSVAWLGRREHSLRKQLGLSVEDCFLPQAELVQQFVRRNSDNDLHVVRELDELEKLMSAMREKATRLDPTLRSSAEAALAKMRRQAMVLEKKMLRAEKRKMQDKLSQLLKLKELIFPGGGLQERTDNFMPWFLQYGREYLDILYAAIDPARQEFLVLEEEN